MKNLVNKLAMAMVLMLVIPSISVAAKMDHSKMDHSKTGRGMKGPGMAQPKAVKKGRLNQLSTMSTSGRSREAGYDSRYAMEPTSTRTRLSEKCAQATRGLVMLDNATWKRCGGKPKGAAMGPGRGGAKAGSHQNMRH